MGTKIEEQVKQQEITAVQIAEVRQVYKHFCCKEVMMHHTIIHLQDSVTRIFARPHTKSPVAVAVWRRIHLKFTSFDKKLHHWEQVQQLELCDSRSILAPLTLSERGIMLCAVLLCISSSAICASWIPCISSLAFLFIGAKDCLELSWNEICCCKSASPVSGSPWTGLLRCSTNPSGWLMSPKFYNYDQHSITSFHQSVVPCGILSISFGFCRWKSIDCFPLHSTATDATVLQDGWTKGIERGAIRGAIQFLHSATRLHWSSLNVFICIMIFMRMLPWALHL